MADIQKLKDMLDNLINGKPEQAQVVFHDYLKTRVNGKLSGEQTEVVQDTKTKE